MNVSLNRLRQYEQPRKRNYIFIFEALLFALIVGLLLAALAAGVGVYKNISDKRTADEQGRAGLTLIANSVRNADAIDAIGVGAGPEGQALVLSEYADSGTYETRIYEYQGNVVEEYAVSGTSYTPGRASQVVSSDSFSFSYAKGLLTISTDQGSTSIALRSVREGA
jgi:uncharacterized protein YodC (DUF2158 family)